MNYPFPTKSQYNDVIKWSFFIKALHFLLFLRRSQGSKNIHSPFVYQLYQATRPHLEDEKNKKIEGLRKRLKRNHDSISKTTVSQIAKKSLSSYRFSFFLVKLSNFINAKVIVEAGTSFGVNSLYLCTSKTIQEIYTIEKSNEISRIAKENFKRYANKKIHLVEGDIYEKFYSTIEKVQPNIIFLDASHYGKTIKFYIKGIMKLCPKIKCIVIHDIYWSKDMLTSWKHLTQNPSFQLTIDMFHAGLLFPNVGLKNKQHFNLLYL